ncbi:MAG: restriction endonuclease subunit S [Pseudomonadota bacterium]
MRNNDTVLGRLPEDWDVVPIGKMYDFTKKPKEILYSNYDHLPFIAMDLIPIDILYLDKFKLKKSTEISSGTYIEDGDILLAKITPCFENGKQCIVTGLPNGFGIASTEIIPIKEKAGTSSKYFLYYYLLKSDVRKLIAGKMEGATGRQRVPVHLIKELSIPFPLLSEQQEIAAVLYNIQQAIEIQKSIIEKAQELKKSTLHHVFTNGLLGKKLKETEIGPRPESWIIQKIGNLGKIVTGTTPPTKHREYYQGGHYQFIAPNDIGKTTRIYKTEKKITDKGLEVSRLLPKESVCFVCIGSTIGKVGITVEEKTTTNQQINTVIVNNDYDPYFVTYLMDYKSEYIASFASPSPVPILSKGKFEKISIMLSPDMAEQREIARVMMTIDETIEIHAAKKSALQVLFKAMLNKLMTGDIRAKDLDVDVSEVSA